MITSLAVCYILHANINFLIKAESVRRSDAIAIIIICNVYLTPFHT